MKTLRSITELEDTIIVDVKAWYAISPFLDILTRLYGINDNGVDNIHLVFDGDYDFD